MEMIFEGAGSQLRWYQRCQRKADVNDMRLGPEPHAEPSLSLAMISLVYYTFPMAVCRLARPKVGRTGIRDAVCKAIKLAQQLWRRQSIFSMARAASFMLMLEPHDRHVSTQVPLLPPESPQPLEPSLSCILRRCSGKNPASVLCIITLDRPDELLDCTVLYYHNSILSASCRGPAYQHSRVSC